MAKKIGKRNIRKLVKTGRSSICVTLPKEYVRKLKWRAKQKVVIKLRGSKMTIEDWKP